MDKNFLIAKYEVILEAGADGLLLPPYKGSTLRGGFGSAFKRISCSHRDIACQSCLLSTGCPYAYIFETAPPPGSEALRNYESIPRPFIIEPPLDTRTEYRPSEEISFNLIIIGRATGYLPYFIVAFRELGDIGVGRFRKKFTLAKIRAVDTVTGQKEVVYKKDEQLVRNVNLARRYDINDVKDNTTADSPIGRIVLDFQTMTRIKFDEIFIRRLEFHMLIRSLLRRLSSLAYFHHGWELDLDFTGLIGQASGVSITEDNTRWVDWQRYSSRQDSKMNMGGLVGRVAYEGDLTRFLPLLRLGELVHVGKGAVFGMGKFVLENN